MRSKSLWSCLHLTVNPIWHSWGFFSAQFEKKRKEKKTLFCRLQRLLYSHPKKSKQTCLIVPQKPLDGPSRSPSLETWNQFLLRLIWDLADLRTRLCCKSANKAWSVGGRDERLQDEEEYKLFFKWLERVHVKESCFSALASTAELSTSLASLTNKDNMGMEN